MPADQNHNIKSHSPELNEQLLLERVSAGDWEAYTYLFNYYLPKLSQYIYPFANQSGEDTEEVIQEVFLKIWERRDTLLSIRSFDSYLFRMAKNRLIDLLAKRKLLRNVHMQYAGIRESFHTQPEQALLFAEYQATAQKAIDQLSPKLQTVFLMSSREELSLDEIAGKLDLPKETVKKRLYLASSFIKNYLRINAEWMALLTGVLFAY